MAKDFSNWAFLYDPQFFMLVSYFMVAGTIILFIGGMRSNSYWFVLPAAVAIICLWHSHHLVNKYEGVSDSDTYGK